MTRQHTEGQADRNKEYPAFAKPYRNLHGMKLNFKHIIALLSVFILIHLTTATFACTCIVKDKQTTERERVDKFETIDRIIANAVNV